MANMFKTREEVGKLLAKKLVKYKNRKDVLILAIPRGGVPISYQISKILNLKFDLIIPRKLPIPSDPEAGFGAVINDTVVLNKEILATLNLSKKEIDDVIKEVQKEIKRRNKIYRKGKPFPKVRGKTVIVVDDGLATGYTMLAAIKDLKKQAKKVVVAVPVSSSSAAREIKQKADEFICLHVSSAYIFAVASFYDSFPDLTDEEVIAYLKK